MRILILGGTTEARELAELLAGDRRFEALLSLAGRTRAPKALPLATRSGGFGGAAGLASFLAEGRFGAVIDATHPFAEQISGNAREACRVAGVPLGSIVRPEWAREPGDRWIMASDADGAAAALGAEPKRVLLTLGRLELSAFCAAPQHDYIARTIDPAGDIPLPPRIRFIAERPPFSEEAEAALITGEQIDVIVSKNSGGPQTYGKIAAARHLGVPVVMIARPRKAAGAVLADAAAAVHWLDRLRHERPFSERGV